MLVSQVVNRVLRLLTVIDANQPAEALDAMDVIGVMNAMVTRWEASGLALGWSNVTAVDDTMPSPDEAEEAIVYNTALRVCSEYNKQMKPNDMDLARQFLGELRRDRLVEMPLRIVNDLPAPEASNRWNILTDEPSGRGWY